MHQYGSPPDLRAALILGTLNDGRGESTLINEAADRINTCPHHARTARSAESKRDGTLAMLYLARCCIQNTTDVCLISTEEESEQTKSTESSLPLSRMSSGGARVTSVTEAITHKTTLARLGAAG